MVAGPICRCPNGHVFESRVFDIRDSVNIRVTGGGKESCPECGELALILDATYSTFRDFVRVSLHETLSPEALSEVRSFLFALSEREAPPTPEEVDREFPTVSAELRDWLRQLIVSIDWRTVRRFLAFILPLLVAWKMDVDNDRQMDRVEHQLQRVEERTEQIYREWLAKEPTTTTTTTTSTTTADGVVTHPKPTESAHGRANPRGTPPQQRAKTRRKRPKPRKRS